MARILLIEDNLANRQLMTYLLHAFGHAVLEAETAEEGCIRASEEPDLILCDIHLPDSDGYQVARYLKSHPRLRSIPLVAVTALAMVGDRDRGLKAGFDGYLSKPIDPEAFVRQVEGFLNTQAPDPRGISSPPVSHLSEPAAVSKLPAVQPPHHELADKKAVLVVDNLTVNLELARSILEPFGYQVRTARSVNEALSAVRVERCDLILSDVCIGQDSGFNFLRAVLADADLKTIPVVFITSTMLDLNVQAEALAMGAARYLTRPIEPETLLAEIAECLAQWEDRAVQHGDHSHR